MQNSPIKELCALCYACLLVALLVMGCSAQGNSTLTQWPYDADYKPITEKQITQLIRGKRTPQEQESLISRAAMSKLLDIAVVEYLAQAKLRREDATLQSAFGYAYFLAEASSSKTPLYQNTHSLKNYYFAVQALKQGVKLAPKEPFGWRALAYAGISNAASANIDSETLSSTPSFKHSLEYLQKAVNLSPNDPRTYRLIAWGYSFRTKYQDKDRSLTAAKKAAQIAPKSSDALYRLALAEFDKQNYKVAYDWLQKSYALRPPEFRYASFLAYYKRMAESEKG